MKGNVHRASKGSDCHRPGQVNSWLLAAACLVTAAGTTASAQSVAGANGKAEVHGTATYRERIALPPNALFEATLEDHSRADAPADVLGSARVESPGQVPIRFGIPCDPSRIQERHSYSVRGRITVDGQPWFMTERIHPILTGGHPSTVELVLRRVSGSPRVIAASGVRQL